MQLKSEIIAFILKTAGIYLCWYFLYELWLLPEGSLDQWLTTNVVAVSGGIMDALGYNYFAAGRLIGINNAPGILLVDGCSGISAMGLFVGFVIAYPGEWIPRGLFILIGMGIIYLVNILRVLVLVITQDFWPAVFDFTHDYSTSAIFYMVIFVLWMIWVNASDKQNPGNRLNLISKGQMN